ncbi:MAG: hypothetical protein GXP59_02580 [Deltaproteobacteria bacterium]|nr:hypothetical protein [Deltaproteobacteria bacterium]
MIRRKIFLAVFFLCFLLPALALAAKKEIHSGTVVTVEKAGNYSIIQLQEAGKKIWLAAGAFGAAVGDKIEYAGGVPMSDFYSKSLKRKFHKIIFITNIRKAKVARIIPGAKMPRDKYHQNMAKSAPVVAAPVQGEIKITKNEMSIADLFKKRLELAGKLVSVRGKILKFSKNILGRTWVTLADGTGKAPDNKLLVTTQQEVALGKTVSFTGKVKANVNLGAGYKYKVVLEEAVFSK